ncbi:MAG: NAD(P)/FAD-dependent oxidoreductase [Verrucomicrobiales bacterium]|nr:NAD(P)/FAD-dependent oxidoreductase [Verrucomicrobiales bacterium]
MAAFDFDGIVIGGGSAGYAAARTLVTGGARVAVVEGGRDVGGLCILRGCMPTKALLQAAALRQAIRTAGDWGIHAGPVTVDVPALFARKDALIREFADHRRTQLEDGRWEFLRARARFTGPHSIQLDDGRSLTARHFVIATGSEIAPPPVPGLAEAGFLDSDSALQLGQLPKSLVMLGGGAVALEFAQFFARLGTEVTVVQRSAHVLRGWDTDVAAELETALRAESLQVLTGTHLHDVRRSEGGRVVRLDHAGSPLELRAEAVFHALGRRPATRLNPEAAGVQLESSGHIRTNARQQTTAPHIFAAGDCCGPHEIVHIAIQQGEVAARNILGSVQETDHRLLLGVVFTDPQVAVVGWGEEAALQAGEDLLSARYPFNDHGKSMILGTRHGFVKLLARRRTGELLGGACVGPDAGELIHEVTVALARRMTAGELAAVPHYHPTLAEIWTYPAEEIAEQVG